MSNTQRTRRSPRNTHRAHTLHFHTPRPARRAGTHDRHKRSRGRFCGFFFLRATEGPRPVMWPRPPRRVNSGGESPGGASVGALLRLVGARRGGTCPCRSRGRRAAARGTRAARPRRAECAQPRARRTAFGCPSDDSYHRREALARGEQPSSSRHAMRHTCVSTGMQSRRSSAKSATQSATLGPTPVCLTSNVLLRRRSSPAARRAGKITHARAPSGRGQGLSSSSRARARS